MAVVPVPPTTVSGLATSSLQNQMRDAVRFLFSPPIAELRQVVAQTLATSSLTAITFTVDDIDTDVDGVGGHDTAALTSRYVTRYPGVYALSGTVAYAANATGRRGTGWAINGSVIAASITMYPATAANIAEVAGRTKYITLGIGDYVELYGYQESGGNLATSVANINDQTSASIRWVSM